MSQTTIPGRKDRWIARQYGSRRGLVYTFWYRLLYFLGRYRHYQRIKWQSVERLVFICKGNICRSAYAEVVARSLGIEAVSCGLDTLVGAPANEAAIRSARQRGFCLEEHRTTPIMHLILRKTDLLVAMEPWQIESLGDNLGGEQQLTLLGLWANPVFPHIQDPYGASPAYFDKCFGRIEKSVHEITKKTQKPGS